MKKVFIITSMLLLITLLIGFAALSVRAHPGRTDGSGGHTNHDTGEYHYHHGYPAHDHYDMDGDGVLDCPYNFDDKTDHNTDSEYNSNTPANTETPSGSASPQKKIALGDILGETLILCIFSTPLATCSFWAMLILSRILCPLFGESVGAVLSTIICGAIAFAVIVHGAMQMPAFPWQLILFGVLVLSVLIYCFWDKLIDIFKTAGGCLLYAIINLAIVAVVGVAIIGAMVFISNTDSPFIYGIIAVLVLIGIPVGAYHSKSKLFFFTSLCLCIPCLFLLFYIWLQ